MNALAKKIAIFVDVQNIYYTTRDQHQRSFNYRKFWERISQQGEIVSAIAYATTKTDKYGKADDGQVKFQDALRHIGFEVKLKNYIQRSDGTAKADWDVGMTIDILEIAPTVDVVVLLSGDGDFDILLQKIMHEHGNETIVYGVPMLTANTVKETASSFQRIDAGLLL